MNTSILLINRHHCSLDLQSCLPAEYPLVAVTTLAEAAAALEQTARWCVILATHTQDDQEHRGLFEKIANHAEAIPLLISKDEDINQTVQMANACSFFRVVRADTSPETLRIILADALAQYRLKQNERSQQQRIEVLTITDSLTGCYTRAYAQEQLTKELKRSTRFAHHLSVILCDIDALREINDSFGYQAGDTLMLGFTRTVMRTIRHDIDTISRWGEDEFLIILPETTIRGAGRVATRLQEQFAAYQVPFNDQGISGSASYGVASFSPDIPNRNAEFEHLILIASRCLTQAKAAGGNQILCCP